MNSLQNMTAAASPSSIGVGSVVSFVCLDAGVQHELGSLALRDPTGGCLLDSRDERSLSLTLDTLFRISDVRSFGDEVEGIYQKPSASLGHEKDRNKFYSDGVQSQKAMFTKPGMDESVCDACGKPRSDFWYEHLLQPSMRLCETCFMDKNFPTGLEEQSFVRHRTWADNYSDESRKVAADQNRAGSNRIRAVRYGQAVRLAHYSSNKLLAIDKAMSSNLVLTNVKNDDTWFTILPVSSLKSRGDLICRDDAVYLLNYFNYRYIYSHASISLEESVTSPRGTKRVHERRNTTAGKEALSSEATFNMSQVGIADRPSRVMYHSKPVSGSLSKSPWRMCVYRSILDTVLSHGNDKNSNKKAALLCGSPIYLGHTQFDTSSEGFLHIRDRIKNYDPMSMESMRRGSQLNNLSNEWSASLRYLPLAAEGYVDAADRRHFNFHPRSAWTLVQDSPNDGGVSVQEGGSYRLLNLSSNFFMGVIPQRVARQQSTGRLRSPSIANIFSEVQHPERQDTFAVTLTYSSDPNTTLFVVKKILSGGQNTNGAFSDDIVHIGDKIILQHEATGYFISVGDKLNRSMNFLEDDEENEEDGIKARLLDQRLDRNSPTYTSLSNKKAAHREVYAAPGDISQQTGFRVQSASDSMATDIGFTNTCGRFLELMDDQLKEIIVRVTAAKDLLNAEENAESKKPRKKRLSSEEGQPDKENSPRNTPQSPTVETNAGPTPRDTLKELADQTLSLVDVGTEVIKDLYTFLTIHPDMISSTYSLVSRGSGTDRSQSNFSNIDSFDHRGYPIPSRQRLMRTQNILSTVFSLLQKITSLPQRREVSVRRFCVLMNRLVIASLRKCSRNQFYLRCECLKPLLDQQTKFAIAQTVLTETMRDNLELLSDGPLIKAIHESLTNINTHSESTRTEPYMASRMRLLRNLCMCNGVPVPDNQLAVVTLLSQNKNFLPVVELSETGGVVQVSADGSKEARRIVDLTKIHNDFDALSTFEEFLLLCACLCEGKSATGLAFVKTVMRMRKKSLSLYRHVVNVINAGEIYPSVRRVYCILAGSLVVHRGGRRHIDKSTFIEQWVTLGSVNVGLSKDIERAKEKQKAAVAAAAATATDPAGAPSTSGDVETSAAHAALLVPNGLLAFDSPVCSFHEFIATYSYISETLDENDHGIGMEEDIILNPLKDGLLDYLKNISNYAESFRYNAEMTLAMVELLHEMVSVGHFIDSVSGIQSLVSVANSVLSHAMPQETNTSPTEYMRTSLVARIKLTICKIIDLAYDSMLQSKLALLFLKFSEWSVKSEEIRAKAAVAKWTSKNVDFMRQPAQVHFEGLVNNLWKIVDNPLEGVDIRKACKSLLIRHHGSSTEVVSAFQKVRVLVISNEQMVQLYSLLFSFATFLRNNTMSLSQFVLGRKMNQAALKEKSTTKGGEVTQMGEQKGPSIRKAMAIFTKYTMKELDGRVSSDDVSSKSNLLFRRFFEGVGLHRIFLDVLRNCSILDPRMRPLMKQIYAFLLEFAGKNSDNARALSPHVGVFLSHMEKEIYAEFLVYHITKDQRRLALGFPEKHIRLIMAYIGRSNWRPIYMRILRNLVYSAGAPIPHNQKLCMRLIHDTFPSALVLYNSPLGLQTLEAMISTMIEDFVDSPTLIPALFDGQLAKRYRKSTYQKLLYHVQFIRFLADCARGPANGHVEAQCRSLVPLHMIYKILGGSAYPPNVKEAYCELLKEAYVLADESVRSNVYNTEMSKNGAKPIFTVVQPLYESFENLRIFTVGNRALEAVKAGGGKSSENNRLAIEELQKQNLPPSHMVGMQTYLMNSAVPLLSAYFSPGGMFWADINSAIRALMDSISLVPKHETMILFCNGYPVDAISMDVATNILLDSEGASTLFDIQEEEMGSKILGYMKTLSRYNSSIELRIRKEVKVKGKKGEKEVTWKKVNEPVENPLALARALYDSLCTLLENKIGSVHQQLAVTELLEVMESTMLPNWHLVGVVYQEIPPPSSVSYAEPVEEQPNEADAALIEAFYEEKKLQSMLYTYALWMSRNRDEKSVENEEDVSTLLHQFKDVGGKLKTLEKGLHVTRKREHIEEDVDTEALERAREMREHEKYRRNARKNLEDVLSGILRPHSDLNKLASEFSEKNSNHRIAVLVGNDPGVSSAPLSAFFEDLPRTGLIMTRSILAVKDSADEHHYVKSGMFRYFGADYSQPPLVSLQLKICHPRTVEQLIWYISNSAGNRLQEALRMSSTICMGGNTIVQNYFFDAMNGDSLYPFLRRIVERIRQASAEVQNRQPQVSASPVQLRSFTQGPEHEIMSEVRDRALRKHMPNDSDSLFEPSYVREVLTFITALTTDQHNGIQELLSTRLDHRGQELFLPVELAAYLQVLVDSLMCSLDGATYSNVVSILSKDYVNGNKSSDVLQICSGVQKRLGELISGQDLRKMIQRAWKPVSKKVKIDNLPFVTIFDGRLKIYQEKIVEYVDADVMWHEVVDLLRSNFFIGSIDSAVSALCTATNPFHHSTIQNSVELILGDIETSDAMNMEKARLQGAKKPSAKIHPTTNLIGELKSSMAKLIVIDLVKHVVNDQEQASLCNLIADTLQAIISLIDDYDSPELLHALSKSELLPVLNSIFRMPYRCLEPEASGVLSVVRVLACKALRHILDATREQEAITRLVYENLSPAISLMKRHLLALSSTVFDNSGRTNRVYDLICSDKKDKLPPSVLTLLASFGMRWAQKGEMQYYVDLGSQYFIYLTKLLENSEVSSKAVHSRLSRALEFEYKTFGYHSRYYLSEVRSVEIIERNEIKKVVFQVPPEVLDIVATSPVQALFKDMMRSLFKKRRNYFDTPTRLQNFYFHAQILAHHIGHHDNMVNGGRSYKLRGRLSLKTLSFDRPYSLLNPKDHNKSTGKACRRITYLIARSYTISILLSLIITVMIEVIAFSLYDADASTTVDGRPSDPSLTIAAFATLRALQPIHTAVALWRLLAYSIYWVPFVLTQARVKVSEMRSQELRNSRYAHDPLYGAKDTSVLRAATNAAIGDDVEETLTKVMLSTEQTPSVYDTSKGKGKKPKDSKKQKSGKKASLADKQATVLAASSDPSNLSDQQVARVYTGVIEPQYTHSRARRLTLWIRVPKITATFLSFIFIHSRLMMYTLLYFLWSFVASIFPTDDTWGSVLFNCLHLLDIVILVKPIRRMLSTILSQWRQFLAAFMVALVSIILLTAIGFVYFRNKYFTNSQYYCESLWKCFMHSVNWSLRSYGGIADVMEPIDDYDSSDEFLLVYLRLVFDLSGFVLSILFAATVFSIVIHAFGEESRDAREMETWINDTCFICGLRRDDFNRHGKDFSHHKSAEHNIWDYILFLLYLQRKPNNELSGSEKKVFAQAYPYGPSRKSWSPDIGFFPIARSLSLESHHSEGRI